MASMTEDMGRIAGGIAASRQARMEAGAERAREAGSRHRAVGHQLRDIKTMRETMGREQRKDMGADRRSRLTDVEALLKQFHDGHEQMAAAARTQAAAFMSDLTARVVSLRDAFSASQKARVASCHELADAMKERLALHRRDRRDADAAWKGMSTPQASPPSPVGMQRPATQPYAAKADPTPAAPAAFEPAAPAAPAAEPSFRSGRQRGSHLPGDDKGSS